MITLSQLLDNTAEAAYAVDDARRIAGWNRAAANLFGLAPAEVLGRPCHKVIAGRDDRGNAFCRHQCEVQGSLDSNSLPPSCSFCVRTKGGEAMWLSVSIVVIPPSRDTAGHLLHLVRPIDRQKRLEDFLRQTLSEGAGLMARSHLPASPVSSRPPLSSRELEILRLLSRGVPTREVAHTLTISRATVRTHVQNILGKLGVHSKVEAVLYAVQQQLLSSGA